MCGCRYSQVVPEACGKQQERGNPEDRNLKKKLHIYDVSKIQRDSSVLLLYCRKKCLKYMN